MTINLQLHGEKCLYEQIYEHIRQEIKEGRLLTGERLPSTRSLAEYLQVARSTVDTAYDQLVSEGYIEAKPYKGYYVCKMEEGIWNAEDARLPGRQGSQVGGRQGSQEAGQRDRLAVGGQEAGQRSRQDNCLQKHEIDFSPHAIDMTGFPFSVWKKITKNTLNDGNQELFAQGETQGDWELRLTISRYLHNQRGVNCRPEQLVLGAGNDYLLLLLQKILGQGITLAMENPTYIRARRNFEAAPYRIVTVGMDENGISVPQLAATDATVAYVMPSHQFPTGIVMPIGRRTELLKWAEMAENRYIIEDDYDSEFRYRGKPIPALQASDEKGKVIYIGTFSKAIAPAIRVSYMVLPETLLGRFYEACNIYSCTVSRIDQSILNEFIRDGYFERHLNKMRKSYRTKHELLLEKLAPFTKHFAITGENAGLHLVLKVLDGRTERELIDVAAEEGVRVYGMQENCADGAEINAAILLGFGGLSSEEIELGIHRLEKAWGIKNDLQANCV